MGHHPEGPLGRDAGNSALSRVLVSHLRRVPTQRSVSCRDRSARVRVGN